MRGYDRIAPGIEQAYLTHATLAAAGASNLIRINNSSGVPSHCYPISLETNETNFLVLPLANCLHPSALAIRQTGVTSFDNY